MTLRKLNAKEIAEKFLDGIHHQDLTSCSHYLHVCYLNPYDAFDINSVRSLDSLKFIERQECRSCNIQKPRSTTLLILDIYTLLIYIVRVGWVTVFTLGSARALCRFGAVGAVRLVPAGATSGGASALSKGYMEENRQCVTNGGKERGAFILFEGVDRCGKTTQANLLVESLKKTGHKACFMRFPGTQILSDRDYSSFILSQSFIVPAFPSVRCMIQREQC